MLILIGDDLNEILRTENIIKSFDGKTVLGGIDITLRKGEIVSIIGGSGVGKTTLFNVISGLTQPDEGRVLLNGEDVTGASGHVSYMLQKDMLLPHKKVIDNVSLPLVIGGMKKSEARDKAAVHFREFGLEGYEYKYPSELSGGMRQRAALLRTYLCGKDAMLLDEPFSALDTITREKMHEWFLDTFDKLEISALFITHDVDEAILISDRIYVIKGSPAKVEGEVAVREPKPRGGDFILSDIAVALKRQIRGKIA